MLWMAAMRKPVLLGASLAAIAPADQGPAVEIGINLLALVVYLAQRGGCEMQREISRLRPEGREIIWEGVAVRLALDEGETDKRTITKSEG
jgi:hypothetical protein